MVKQLFCSDCRCLHDQTDFGTRQRRKSATTRVCKKAKLSLKYSTEEYWPTQSDRNDYLEFGKAVYEMKFFYTEKIEEQWAKADQWEDRWEEEDQWEDHSVYYNDDY